jgi:hypothetical protein
MGTLKGFALPFGPPRPPHPPRFPLRGLRDPHLPHHTRSLRSRPRARPRQTLRPATRRPTPLAAPFGDFGTCTCPTSPARSARALALGLARWYAASNEGAREARGVGAGGVGPDVPAGGARRLPTRLHGKNRPFVPCSPRCREASMGGLDRRSGRASLAALMGFDANRAKPGRQRL